MSNPKTPQTLFVRASHDGYRRAGFVHSRAGQHIPLEALSEEQVRLLKSDPHLVVEGAAADTPVAEVPPAGETEMESSKPAKPAKPAKSAQAK